MVSGLGTLLRRFPSWREDARCLQGARHRTSIGAWEYSFLCFKRRILEMALWPKSHIFRMMSHTPRGVNWCVGPAHVSLLSMCRGEIFITPLSPPGEGVYCVILLWLYHGTSECHDTQKACPCTQRAMLCITNCYSIGHFNPAWLFNWWLRREFIPAWPLI